MKVALDFWITLHGNQTEEWARHARLRQRRAWVGSLLLTSGLVLLTLLPLGLSSGILMRGDVALYFYPYWEAAARATREGRLPLWNPDLFAGVPFLANPQVGFFYPPNRVLSWLPVPTALKVSILLHTLWAAWGMLGLARRLGYRTGGSVAAAVAYALGGYFLAQAEHINQFQALAWLPWMAWAWAAGRPAGVGLAGAMQLLCGHAQTVMLSWIALLVFFAPSREDRTRLSGWVRAWGTGVLGGALALGLSAVQWLPSLELTRASIRAGGLPLNEALSFSLSPLLLGRSLLPGQAPLVLTEFIAYIGILGGLSLVAGIGRPGWTRWAAVAGLGLFLALGIYNPIAVLLVGLLPPLRAFRVPARWLALWAFGAALGIGAGFDQGFAGLKRWQIVIWALGTLALMGLAVAAGPIRPPGMTGPLGPASGSFIILGLGLLGIGFLHIQRRLPRGIWLGLWAAELIGAAWGLPVNRLTAPAAWSDPRLPAVVLRDLLAQEGPWAGRILSVVDLHFDPGDLGEWRSVLEGQLPAEAFAEFVIATKYKEALVANLPMVYGLPTVDGYDGGVLPLRRYIELVRRFVPVERLLMDGRLWEALTALPEPRWLQLLGVRWILMDRLRDEWIDGVFYDRGVVADACGGEPIEAGPFPPFEATELRLRVASSLSPRTPWGRLCFAELGETLEFSVEMEEEGRPVVVDWKEPRTILGVSLRPLPEACAQGGWRVEGGALVDRRTGAFQALVLSPGGSFALRYAGDIKIYEFRKALPRIYGVCTAEFARDEAEAMGRLAEPTFDPSRMVVLEGEAIAFSGASRECPVEVRWIRFTPEVREAAVRLEQPGWLVLMESFDPGWRATVDGRAAPILRANGLFQAIPVPAGGHTVRWEYRPGSWTAGLMLTLASALAALGAWGYRRMRVLHRSWERG